jgi:NADP-dependent 3-hydroxy acid dehydrogenase YdfG
MGGQVVQALATDHLVIAFARADDALTRLRRLPNVTAVKLDLLDFAAVERAGERILAEHPKIRVLAQIAATSSPVGLEESDLTLWQTTLGTNIVAPALLTRALLPGLRAGQATVVFVNSGAGKRALPDHIVYTSSKHALTGFANSLRLAESSLRVTTVFPGQTDTKMLRSDHEAKGWAFEPETYIRPDSVANAIRWVVDSGPDVQITNIDVRPRHEIAPRFSV